MINPEEELDAANLDQLREQLGLNQPLPVRYAIWLGRLCVATLAILLSTIFGITVGVIAALKQHTVWDYLLSTLALFSLSIPAFFFALIAIYLFAF
jgi:ABC-type dipeptide/oligopeptide/nickel transport system permease component